MSDSNTWRYPAERDELVERLVESERTNRRLEDELRQRVKREELWLAGHPREKELVERVAELEGIVMRLNETIARRRSA